MNVEEFLKPKNAEPASEPVETPSVEASAPEAEGVELDVQKAVVEDLAAEKVAMEEKIADKDAELAQVKAELEQVKAELAEKSTDAAAVAAAEQIKADAAKAKAEAEKAQSEILNLKAAICELQSKLAAEQAKEVDTQERNPNALALLDRDVDLPDRFPGETRDHVLEVIQEARAKAEADGRSRRAQVLEAVLVANEPNGTLAQRRADLEKLFTENANIVNGPVLEELQKLGISHKNGEEYLLPSEIMKRSF